MALIQKYNPISGKFDYVNETTGSDINAKNSAADTTTGYIDDKIAVKAGKLVKTTLNPAGNEQLELDIGTDVFDKVTDDTDDITEGAANKFNVDTDLSVGTKTATTLDVNSSDGANATLPEATATEAGLLSSAKRAEIIANTAKVSNVTTDLSTTQTATTVDVVSSDGNDATLPQAIAAGNAGVMSGADKTLVDGSEQTSQKGINNGYAPLDASAVVPLINLPASVQTGSEYKGAYNATTNVPVIIDGTGSNGDYYRVAVAGTQDFGAGNIVFDAGDLVLYNGTTTVWEKVDGNPDLVVSVAGKQGIVTLDAADITDFDAEVSNNVSVAANTAKVSDINHNVTTDLSEGTATETTVVVESSDGTNAILAAATAVRAGLMSKAKFDEVVLNNAKLTNVSTDLSVGTKTASTVDINSSDGNNVTVPQFTDTEAGLTPASGGGIENYLRADGTFAPVLGGGVIFGSPVSATLAANTDDLVIADIENNSIIYLTPSTSSVNLTGLDSSTVADNQTFWIYNVGTVAAGTNYTITFTNNDANSLAANRFQANNTIAVKFGMGVQITYNATASKWVCMYFK